MEKFIQFLQQVINRATELHVANFGNAHRYDLSSIYGIEPPFADLGPTHLADLIQTHNFNFQEQVVLLLALAPHFAPQTLDIFLAQNPNFGRICTEFGGVVEGNHRGVIPTGETAAFILAGRDQGLRRKISELFLDDHPFARNHLLHLEAAAPGQPLLAGRLVPDEDLIQKLMYGKVLPPRYSPRFPAQNLSTKMEWKDLVLPESTRNQLEDVENWLQFGKVLQDHPELGRSTQPGYRALFYGPPGTGKTLTAALLGKSTGRPVFRIDLSQVVSKWIGETEKNLAGIFSKAEHKDWILFFDEADALFGKRTSTDSANDRFANQEVAYLLQRIESYNGMAILATNLKQNIDAAFMRRFQSIIHFPAPRFPERVMIWERYLPSDLQLEDSISLEKLARNYDLTASQINNIVQGCFIEARSKGQAHIERDNLRKNMQKELSKEDMIFEVLY